MYYKIPNHKHPLRRSFSEANQIPNFWKLVIGYWKFPYRNLFGFFMGCVLLTPPTVLLQLQPRFNCLLVLRGVVIKIVALRALELNEIVLRHIFKTL